MGSFGAGNGKREHRRGFHLIRFTSFSTFPSRGRLRGKAFNRPFLSHTKTGDGFAAVSGFVFYFVGFIAVIFY